MNIKKLNCIFAVIVVLLIVACVVHVALVYNLINKNPYNGTIHFYLHTDPPKFYVYPPYYYAYPPEVAFLLIIPYAFAELITVIIWLILRKKAKTQNNDSNNRGF